MTWGRTTGRQRKRWTLDLTPAGFRLEASGHDAVFTGEHVAALSVRRSWFRPVLRVSTGASSQTYRGLNRTSASELERALDAYLIRHRVAPDVALVRDWVNELRATLDSHRTQGRWLPRDERRRLERTRPSDAIQRLRRQPSARLSLAVGSETIGMLDEAERDLPSVFTDLNAQVLASESRLRKDFFDRVESSPLTEEQRRAVITYDNSVQVVAAAGSGKTSVMVARAAYAVSRGFTTPDRILLLAFNKAAAQELQTRVDKRLKVLGLPTAGLRADTFHAFGLRTIGDATGRKPRPAPWLESGQDVDEVVRIVDTLRDDDPDFRYQWDLFRLIYARSGETPDAGDPDGYDAKTRRTGFRTFRNEVVRSQGERMIADWLYLNGVDYQYEQKYAHDVADREHSQYRPDFYYPYADVWHEHWALDVHGNPPPEFAGYATSMEWKRQVHRRYGTTLVETTWAQIIEGRGWTALGNQLEAEGIELDWNPDRPLPKYQTVEHEDLARLVRTFMTHVKSSSLTRETLDARLVMSGGASPRTQLFLDIYWPIHERWDQRLRDEGYVDFEDMLVLAAEHLENGSAQSNYDLVLVDELQDSSQARARLTRALTNGPDRYLLAVGDDWQSINRFAGADLSVMTAFDQLFGESETVRLQTTFRCTQTVADVATAFVGKNPRQLAKKVVSAAADRPGRVAVTYVAGAQDITDAIVEYLDELAPHSNQRRPLTVDILGRYRFDRSAVPQQTPPSLNVTFRTVHGSKGLEADYVVIPNITNSLYGFPSRIADDPVMDVVMAEPDGFPYAEERRLFYVALTRAKRDVMMFAVRGQESPFLVELIKDGLVEVLDSGAELEELPEVCPACGQGVLRPRTGRYGDFLGCSTFPRCRYTRNGF